LVILWNRKAPNSLPSSAVIPQVGSLPFTNTPMSDVEEEDESPVENSGVEKMKEFILAGLPPGLMPQGWSYRVCSCDIVEIRCTVHTKISINNPRCSYGRLPNEESA
jgi:hypothetical protein